MHKFLKAEVIQTTANFHTKHANPLHYHQMTKIYKCDILYPNYVGYTESHEYVYFILKQWTCKKK